jgi:hypothetical protein
VSSGGDARPGAALRRITFSLRDRGALYSLEEVVEETGAEPRLIACADVDELLDGGEFAAHLVSCVPAGAAVSEGPPRPHPMGTDAREDTAASAAVAGVSG